jgi:hypothetical protein
MNHVLDVAFLALSALFVVWNARALARYVTYRRVARTAELTWRTTRPWFLNTCVAIGFVLTSMTLLSVFVLDSPPLAIAAQSLMAVYYTLSYPLSMRIPKGFYHSGVWTDTGFVPYRRFESVNWLLRPDTVLVVETAGLRHAYARLRIPDVHYSEARTLLSKHLADNRVNVDGSILGLEPEADTGDGSALAVESTSE